MAVRKGRNIPLTVLGIVICVASIGIMIGPLMLDLSGMTRGAVRIVVPGAQEIELTKAGAHTIFYEWKSEVDGETYRGGVDPHSIVVTLTGEAGQIEVEPIEPFSRYNMDKHAGYSAFQFNSTGAGRYHIETRYDSGKTTPETVLSITPWAWSMLKFAAPFTVGMIVLALGIALTYAAGKKASIKQGAVKRGMVYENGLAFTGNAERAIEFAKTELMGNKFTVESSGEHTLEATGPGMRNSNQPPLQGATKITIDTSGSKIRVRADLGGIRWIRNFLLIFPPVMCVGLFALFGGLWLADVMPAMMMWLQVVIMIPIIVMGPILIPSIRKRTTNAIDILIEDMRRAAEGHA